MSPGVLDTSVLIANDIVPIPGEFAISTASLAELSFGVLGAKSEEARAVRLSRVTTLQRRFDPLSVDDAVTASYGPLAARVVRLGRQPRARVMDLLVAATAHAHGATLYTRNADDLAGLEDLMDIVALRHDRACRRRPPGGRAGDAARTGVDNMPRSGHSLRVGYVSPRRADCCDTVDASVGSAAVSPGYAEKS